MTVTSGEPEPVIDFEAIKGRWETYQNAIDENHVRWKETPYLDGIDEKYAKQAAMILENERLFLEGATNVDETFLKVGLTLVQKVLQNFLVFDMVSVQPMLGPTGYVFGKKYRYRPEAEGGEIALDLHEFPMTAKTRIMRACMSGESPFGGEWLDGLASEIRNEITREVMTDLRNNAGTVSTRTIPPDLSPAGEYESYYVNIVEMSGVVHRKTLRGGVNWLTTGVETGKKLARALHRDVNLDNLSGPTKVGVLNGAWTLIVDPLFPEGKILCGRHEPDGLLDGYFYSPYVLLSLLPAVFDPDSFCRRSFIQRYSKRLVSFKPYGYITYSAAAAATNYQI